MCIMRPIDYQSDPAEPSRSPARSPSAEDRAPDGGTITRIERTRPEPMQVRQ